MLALNRSLSCMATTCAHRFHGLSSCKRFSSLFFGDGAACTTEIQMDHQEETRGHFFSCKRIRAEGGKSENRRKMGKKDLIAKRSCCLFSTRFMFHPAVTLAAHLSMLPSPKHQEVPEQNDNKGAALEEKPGKGNVTEDHEGIASASWHVQKGTPDGGTTQRLKDSESAGALGISSSFRSGLSSITQGDLSIASKLAPADSLWTTEKDGAVRFRMEQTGPGSEPPITIHQLFQQTLQHCSNKPALAVKRDGQWKTITFLQYYQNCRAAAKGFLKLGLQRFHGVAILGYNSPEWFFANIGAILAGGLATGIYTTSSSEACQYFLENCEANIIVVEDHQQLKKILKVQHELPKLKAIVQYRGELQEKRPNLYTWEEFMQLGSDIPDSQLDDVIASQKVNQCCTLIYTSGTTGKPKGVMLSHDNVTWTTKAMKNTLGLIEDVVTVSYLPLCHIAGQVYDIWLPMNYGGTTYFAEPDALKGSLITTLQEVHPTVFLGVPRVWEKIQEKLKHLDATSSIFRRKATAWATAIGLRANYNRMNRNNSVPWGYTLANYLVLKKIQAAVGLDRCHTCNTGAAPISKDMLEYFMSINLPLYEVNGMSESSGPHTLSTQNAFQILSCGKDFLGCRTRIDKPDKDGNGEVCYWGRDVFMGYLNMKEKTEEALDEEGWLHSGDVGKLDQQGFLYLTGRIKDLIITAGGKNIPPIIIEAAVKEEVPIISNAMLIGDRRKFLSMLLTLKCNFNPDTGEPQDELSPEAVQFCRELGSRATRVSEVISSKDPAVYKAIQEGIERVNGRAESNAHRVQKWTILEKDFSIYGGELGPTMKLKCHVVLQRYQDEIDAFYKL
ncbi:long-chain-fatty-acid--CoA ligase ACSBG2 isoform X2 [Microcaecilia unicolor]|uniref:long-chain-fatty-acid--CoA ligase n=1 Tax=Microcaecilia unicolor TaxID=1415580 RepID=A0A6P7X872_9AMPH|nr:long-chain-fatty-acid--CoA ligase ACSBG2-like isoform X2 [Microcaecilia unicolor]